MTRQHDIKARAYLEDGLWPALPDTFDHRPSELRVRQIPIRDARPWLATYHYAQIVPDAVSEAFAGYYPEGVLAGFVTFGPGLDFGQFTRLIPDIAHGEYRELSRLWSPDGMPRNTESRLIASSIQRLPSEVRLIVSYADPAQGHVGIVYQATNFIYLGLTDGGGDRLVDEAGHSHHVKSLSIYRRKRAAFADLTNRDIADRLGWTYIVNGPKHRYAYANRADDRAILAAAASSDAPGLQLGEGGSQPTPPLHRAGAA